MRQITLLARVLLLALAVLGFAQSASAALLGYWNFNEGSGATAFDSSGNGYNGAITGATYAAGPPNLVGGFGTALSFDGNDFVQITGTGLGAHPLALAGTNYTIAWWVKYTNGVRMIEMDDGNDLTGGYATRTDGVSLFLSHLNGGGSFNTTTGVSMGGGAWKHFAVVYNGTNIKVYANGVLAFTSPNTGPLVNEGDDPLLFGAIPVYGQFLVGSLDEVRIYNEALSPLAVEELVFAPEPASAALLALGLTLLGRRRVR